MVSYRLDVWVCCRVLALAICLFTGHLPDSPLRSLSSPCTLQLAEQRRAAQEEAESRELAHLAELEAAQDGILEVSGPLVEGGLWASSAGSLWSSKQAVSSVSRTTPS